MSEKKRYLVGYRFGPQLSPSAQQGIDAFMTQSTEVREIRRTSVGRRVLEMTEEQRQTLAQQCWDVVIEEDEPLYLFGMPSLPLLRAPSDKTYTLTLEVRDEVDNRPVSNATLFGIGQSGLAYETLTNEEGQAELRSSENPLSLLIASPPDTHWSRFIANVDIEASQSLEIRLKQLLATGAYDWGHRLMGFRAVNQRFSGKGVKVAVMDSGVTDRGEDLKPAGGCNTMAGQDAATWHVDEKGHGTHTSGIIAARNSAIGVVGGAPNAQVYSVKVFPNGRVSDLIGGLEWCIHNQIDVVNLGVGCYRPSRVLAGAMLDAYNRGITCVAAAGNDAFAIAYPATLPTTIAVGAIGRFGSFPEESAHALRVSNVWDRYGKLFAANFSNVGPCIDVCAPGVAILSTVPTGYAAWDGTSMAASMVTALVTLILEAYPSIRTGDEQQVEFVRQILRGAAINLGMPPTFQGYGLPLATNALPPTGN